MIAVLVDRVGAFGSSVLDGLSEYASAARHWRYAIQLDIRRSDRPPLRALQIRGLVIQAWDRQLADETRGYRIPIVNVSGAVADTGLPTVTVDSEAIGRMAAQFFLDRNFRHFAYLGHPEAHYSLTRGRAFISVLQKAGFECLADPTHLGERPTRRKWGPELLPWLMALPKPVALFACQDHRASEVVRACSEVGLAVPEQVSILGVDNDPMFASCALSSIDQPGRRVGYAAAKLLDDLIGGKRPPAEPILLPPVGVVSRKTVSDRPIDDQEIARAMTFIRQNASHAIGIDDVARAAFTSRRTLQRRFTRFIGHSVMVEIRRTHLELAQSLLQNTSIPVSDVAAASGFGDPSRFTLLFRQCVGLTPSAYRLRHEASKDSPAPKSTKAP